MSAEATNHLFDRIYDPRTNGDRPFMHLPDGTVVSYGELGPLAARYADALVALGVKTGDRVAVQTEKTPSVIFLYLGCLRLGAIFLPLNTAYTAGEIAYFLEDAEPSLFVCRPQNLDSLRQLPQSAVVAFSTLSDTGGGELAELAATMAGTSPVASRGEDDIAIILYTSGTTGKAKGAMLTHGNLASNAEVLGSVWRYTKDDVLIHALPVFHAHGLFNGTNVTLLAGCSMIFLSRFDPEEVLDAMPRATILMGVPTYYTRLLQNPRLDKEITKTIRVFISGSAPLLADTHHAWKERTGQAILERYGMTETGMNTSNPYDGDRVAGTVGLALPGTLVRVTEPTSGVPLKKGEIGMIEVKGPNVFAGYWKKPEQTRAEFRADGFFITGDLGIIDERDYVHIVGRSKDLVISGGYNVYPKELEIRDRLDRWRRGERGLWRSPSRFRRRGNSGRRAREECHTHRTSNTGGNRDQTRPIQASQTHHLPGYDAAQHDGKGAEGGASQRVQGSVRGVAGRAPAL